MSVVMVTVYIHLSKVSRYVGCHGDSIYTFKQGQQVCRLSW